MALRVLCAILILCVPGMAPAQQLALFEDPSADLPRDIGNPSLFRATTPGAELERRQTASLFAGQTGLFAAPIRNAPGPGPEPGPEAGPVALLRDLIASAEAGAAGYDAVQHGARIRPTKHPTHMTLSEIFAWIDATPGQPHAIGRYQFIPATLRYLVDQLGLPDTTRFDPRLQDRLADVLLEQAGLSEFRNGRLPRHAFMNGIAKIWAGLPNSSGRSHYHGIAGNKAVVTWARFDAEMARIFPSG